jgi:DNA segregation ATPase FtsK/SpoIIIE, S-DNA-T family
MNRSTITIPHKKNILCALVLIIYACMITIGVWLFDIQGASWFYHTNMPSVSYTFFLQWCFNITAFTWLWMGSGGLILIPTALWGAYTIAFKKIITIDRLCALIIMICTTSALSDFYTCSIRNGLCMGGGIIGMTLKNLLITRYGYHAAWVILYGIVWASAFITLHVPALALARYCINSIDYVTHCFTWCINTIHALRDVHAYETLPKPLQLLSTLDALEYQLEDLNSTYTISYKGAIQEHPEISILSSTHTPIQSCDLKNNCIITQPITQKISSPESSEASDEPIVKKNTYQIPSLKQFVPKEPTESHKAIQQEIASSSTMLEEKLKRFGITGRVNTIHYGPVVTLFEYEPHSDVKLSRITALEDDLSLALQTMSLRILAPIPGTSVVGFEVANKMRQTVSFATIAASESFNSYTGALPLILGSNTSGKEIIVDLATMPHVLVAGSTGSGKSVALNAMLISLLCQKNPEELRLILIDPKRLEFAGYTDIAHLIFPIITAPQKAIEALKWAVNEMTERYERMATLGVKNINDHHKRLGPEGLKDMPYIVIVIDELADLMMTAGKDVEQLIARIAQMARAAGIHLIVATQRPSVDVITGLIKVNFPSRISFRVTSKVDSRTILDTVGAERLLGKGDMLFLHPSMPGLQRIHGAWINDDQVKHIVKHIRAQSQPMYQEIPENQDIEECELDNKDKELYEQIMDFVHEVDEISISLLQRKFKIGFNRSARMIDILESQGIISSNDQGKLRKVVKKRLKQL